MRESNAITLTPDALAMAETLSQDAENVGKPLRLYIEGKGCDGFFYGVAFDQEHSDDVVIELGAVRVVIDPETMVYVEGSSISWVDDERGKGFLVDNPHHRKFRGKFYKRGRYQDWLAERRQEIESSQNG